MGIYLGIHISLNVRYNISVSNADKNYIKGSFLVIRHSFSIPSLFRGAEMITLFLIRHNQRVCSL